MKKILLLFCFICGLVGYSQNCLTPVDFGADTSLRNFFLNTNNYTAGYIKDINGNMTINDLVRNGTVCAELVQNVTFINLSGSQNNQVGGILQPGDNPEVAAPGLNITSMEGISAFTGLQYLYAINNNFTTIDLTSNAALIDFRGYDGNGGNGPLQTVNLRGLNNLEVVGLDNNMITELMLEGNSSLRILDARNNQLTALNLTDVTALDRTGLVNNPITCIQVANQITADNYNANPGIYQKDAGATFAVNCIYNIEISLGPQLDVSGFYVIDNGNLDPTLSFDALNLGGTQVTPAELANYNLIINTQGSTTLNPANGGPAPIVRGDGSDFTLITDQAITVPVLNPGIDDTFAVVIEGDDLFEADEFFVIEVSTTDPNINLLNADPDGVVRFNMRVDDTNDTATASLEKVQDGVEGVQDIQYRISMTKTNDTRQDLVFDISITDIDTDAGDYTNVTQATIPDGADEVIFSIPVNPDAVAEPLESLQTTLSYTGSFASRLTVTQPGPITATITDNTQCANAVIFTDPDLEAFFLDPASASRILDQFGNPITDLVINGKVCADRAVEVYTIDLDNGYQGRAITSLGGLEAFTNLEELNMFSANLSGDIDLTMYPSLVRFNADENGINTVTTSPVNVNLVGISVFGQGANDNTLTAVNINGVMPLLDNLVIQDNTSITSINLLNVPKLEFFFSSGTGITRLDFTALESAGSDNFFISEIGGGGSLTEIDIRNNNATFNLVDFFLDAMGHPNLACVLVNTGGDLTQAEQNITDNVWRFDDDTVVKTDCDTDTPIAILEATDPSASEVGPDDGQFTITLSAPVPPGCCPLTINYIVGGTALPGEDYTALTGTVQIPIGGISATIDVNVIDNDDTNDTETAVVTLEAGNNYIVGIPSSDTVTIANSGETIGADDILVIVTSETCEGKNNGKIQVSVSNEDYVFNVFVNGDTVGQTSFGSPLTIDNQENGEYIVCLTISELPAFEQCFGININSFQQLNVSDVALNFVNSTASYFVEGSKSYDVSVNGSLHKFNFNSTSKRPIEVPLDSGENEIIITGISDCQGIFKEAINLQNSIIAFPNPVINNLNLLGISRNENLKIELFSMEGQRIKSFNIQNNASNSVNLPMFDLPIGVYLVRGQSSNENKFELKIVKK